jgi:hypothetical protein
MGQTSVDMAYPIDSAMYPIVDIAPRCAMHLA